MEAISIHALREEDDQAAGRLDPHPEISIHALRGEGDSGRTSPAPRYHISIHALREEGDNSAGYFAGFPVNFYPRPPRGGRRLSVQTTFELAIFLSTPSARRATSFRWTLRPQPFRFLSTPSARRATSGLTLSVSASAISIHALREEGDSAFWRIGGEHTIFLSTPSARRATQRRTDGHRLRDHFYPRPPRGGRPKTFWPFTTQCLISIHALREEGDFQCKNQFGRNRRISIHALREEGDRPAGLGRLVLLHISIHALREEGDKSCWACFLRSSHFYPRPPRGGRLS